MAQDMESIAAALKRIDGQLAEANDRRLDAFKGLLSSIESSLADLLEVVSAGGGEAALKTMAEALRDMKFPEPQVHVHVPEQKAPTVMVEAVIPQAPAPVVHVMPGKDLPRPKSFRLVIQGAHGGPDREATITPIY